MVGGFIALIWCFGTLCASWWIPTPEASLFPEIDFASKLPPIEKLNIMNLEEKPKAYSSVVERSIADFSTLSNAGTLEIKRRLARARFFIQFSKNKSDDNFDDLKMEQEVVLRIEEDGSSSSWPLSNTGNTRVV